jgi:hypothetical protein
MQRMLCGDVVCENERSASRCVKSEGTVVKEAAIVILHLTQLEKILARHGAFFYMQIKREVANACFKNHRHAG